jgi:hypothetical protein
VSVKPGAAVEKAYRLTQNEIFKGVFGFTGEGPGQPCPAAHGKFGRLDADQAQLFAIFEQECVAVDDFGHLAGFIWLQLLEFGRCPFYRGIRLP